MVPIATVVLISATYRDSESTSEREILPIYLIGNMDEDIHKPSTAKDSNPTGPALESDTTPTPQLPGSFPPPGIPATSHNDSFSLADSLSSSPRHLITNEEHSKAPPKDSSLISNETSSVGYSEIGNLKEEESEKSGERENPKHEIEAAENRIVTPAFSSEKEVIPASSDASPTMTSNVNKNVSTENLVSPTTLRAFASQKDRNSTVSALAETHTPVSSAEGGKRRSAVSPIEESLVVVEPGRSIPLTESNVEKASNATYPLKESEPRTFYNSSGSSSAGDQENQEDGDDEREGVDGIINKSDQGAMLAAAKSVRMNRPSRFQSTHAHEVGDYFVGREKEREEGMWEKVGRERARKGITTEGGKVEKVLGEESTHGNGKVGRVLGQESMVRSARSSAGNSFGRKPGLPPVPQSPWLPGAETATEAKDGASSIEPIGPRRSKGMSIKDALRSNPPDSTSPISTKRSSAPSIIGKRTVFAPEPIDVHNKEGGTKWGDGMSTPYPKATGDGFPDSAGKTLGSGLVEGEREMGETRRTDQAINDGRKRFSMFSFMGGEREKMYGGIKPEPSGTDHAAEITNDAILTVVLYKPSNAVPRVGMIAIPQEQSELEISHANKDNGGGPKPPAAFDDEGLFRLMKSQYFRLRGGFLSRLFDARGLKSISLLSYTHISQLAARNEKPVIRKTFCAVTEDMFAEERMLELFQSPRKGKGSMQWVVWVAGLGENSSQFVERYDDNTEKANEEKEKIAIELVEGWNGGKITLAVASVVLLSVAAVLLWIFLGVDGEQREYLGIRGNVKEGEIGFRGAGGRVETGVLLGLIVLLMGWTGIAAWIGLSWFVI